jgi:calcineurin-like phosphoesterase
MEATSEKAAIGAWCDGRAALVVGTHTHVPTADARILRKGTGFITDVGMCGPYDSVIGRDTDAVVRHMTSALPVHYEMGQGDARLCGVFVEISEDTGLANRIERIELA